MHQYLSKKATEVADMAEYSEFNHMYFIPYEEAKNVFRHLDKKEAKYKYRFSWNYDTLIIMH